MFEKKRMLTTIINNQNQLTEVQLYQQNILAFCGLVLNAASY